MDDPVSPPPSYGGETPLCSTLPPELLEATYWYPGISDVRRTPDAEAKKRWGAAKEVCLDCPVYLRCRGTSWGEEYGVWGGTDQHERYRYRANERRRFLNLSPEEQEKIEATLYRLAVGPRGVGAAELARRTGYRRWHIAAVIERINGERAAERREREEAAMTALAAISGPTGPTWPEADPAEGQGWACWDGRIYPAHYLAQTADGRWFRMKFRAAHMQPVRRWFSSTEVDIRFPVEPVIESFSGRKTNAA